MWSTLVILLWTYSYKAFNYYTKCWWIMAVVHVQVLYWTGNTYLMVVWSGPDYLEVTTNPAFLHPVRLITPIIPGQCPSYIPTRFCRVNGPNHFREGVSHWPSICSKCPMSNHACRFINLWTAHLLNVEPWSK